MANIQSVPGSSNSSSFDLAQVGSMTNNQISAALMNGGINSKFATILMAQMASNNVDTILLGSNSGDSNSSTFDPFSTQDIFSASGINNNVNSTDIFGASTASSYVSPQFQMSVYSSLIGKTVSAIDPETGKQFSGKVSSVTTKDGNVVLEVGNHEVAATSILKIQK